MVGTNRAGLQLVILRRAVATLLAALFVVVVAAPSSAGCATSGKAHASHVAHHTHTHHDSQKKAPCYSGDLDCCQALASCAVTFVAAEAATLVPSASFSEAIVAPTFNPSATPAATVDPPPPRA